MGCCNVKCKRIFHFPCGLKAGTLHQFFGEFRFVHSSFLSNHSDISQFYRINNSRFGPKQVILYKSQAEAKNRRESQERDSEYDKHIVLHLLRKRRTIR